MHDLFEFIANMLWEVLYPPALKSELQTNVPSEDETKLTGSLSLS